MRILSSENRVPGWRGDVVRGYRLPKPSGFRDMFDGWEIWREINGYGVRQGKLWRTDLNRDYIEMDRYLFRRCLR